MWYRVSTYRSHFIISTAIFISILTVSFKSAGIEKFIQFHLIQLEKVVKDL